MLPRFFKTVTHTCSTFPADPLGTVVVTVLVAKRAESIAAPEPRGDATSQMSPWRFVTDLRQCNNHDAWSTASSPPRRDGSDPRGICSVNYRQQQSNAMLGTFILCVNGTSPVTVGKGII